MSGYVFLTGRNTPHATECHVPGLLSTILVMRIAVLRKSHFIKDISITFTNVVSLYK